MHPKYLGLVSCFFLYPKLPSGHTMEPGYCGWWLYWGQHLLFTRMAGSILCLLRWQAVFLAAEENPHYEFLPACSPVCSLIMETAFCLTFTVAEREWSPTSFLNLAVKMCHSLAPVNTFNLLSISCSLCFSQIALMFSKQTLLCLPGSCIHLQFSPAQPPPLPPILFQVLH